MGVEMTLGELIALLELDVRERGNRTIPVGFHSAHSYRGDYSQLAFEPKQYASTEDMLREAKAALGKVFCGYKGGNYKMTEWADCNLAYYSECGEEIGPLLMAYMLGRNPPEALRGER